MMEENYSQIQLMPKLTKALKKGDERKENKTKQIISC